VASNAVTGVPECGHQRPPNSSITTSITLAATSDTETGGPRQRANALGPLDADLRARLGERIKWLAMAKLVEHSADTLTLSVLTALQADNIRRHCEPDILAVAGVTRLAFQIEIAAEPNARRRP
jgi:hypothetical protein